MQNLYFIILSVLIGVVVSLTTYIWNQQNKRIKDIESKILPLQNLFPDIREIKTDMSWIKKKLFSDEQK